MDADLKAGLLDLIDHAVMNGWSRRRRSARLGPPRLAERLPILLVPTGALLSQLPAAVDVWLDIGDGYELKPSVSEPSRFESDVVILDPSTRNPVSELIAMPGCVFG